MVEDYSVEELTEQFHALQAHVADVTATNEWERFADIFTEDADYVEHAFGIMTGREQIREWIVRTMNQFPGNHMVEFPALWFVVDVPTSRVICEIDNPMRPLDGHDTITATNITILTYGGNGLWSREEDVYNPMEFGAAAMRWCRAAQERGALTNEAEQWMNTTGKLFRRG